MTEQLRKKAQQLDKEDTLSHKRKEFHLPEQKNGNPFIYLCGNSLGLQPRNTETFVQQELEDWKKLGVEGHFHAQNPWMPYHEFLTPMMAKVVGGKESEVVVMNSLTVNLHLLMVSFYRPTAKRHKIIIEANAFPSDRYAVESQIAYHGYKPEESLLFLPTSPGKSYTDREDIYAFIEKHGEETALILMGGVNYYSGQAFPMQMIVEKGKEKGCMVGFDLAHAAGNLPCDLHESNVDFAAWCTYKYLNSGPGGLSGIFINERHGENPEIPRFAGWWGHDKQSRFKMPDKFVPQRGAEGWQLSNPPILAMAALRASLQHFQEVGMNSLRTKSIQLTNFLESCLNSMVGPFIEIITPTNPEDRGCQLSIRVKENGKEVFEQLHDNGIIADWREPDIIRVAPVPMYNSFTDVFEFSDRLHQIIESKH